MSTCQVQLVMAGTFLMGVIGALIHPNFWQFVGQHYWWPISIVIIILWHIISQMLLNKYVTADGKRIKWPFLWLFAYVALSAAYCMVCHSSLFSVCDVEAEVLYNIFRASKKSCLD